MSDAELSGARLAAVPDTTSAWRYFPLAVGNVWEYESNTYAQRYEVTKDTLALGYRYFVVERRNTLNPGNVILRDYLRFDTTSATPHEYVRVNGQPNFDKPYSPQCPLSAAFGETVACVEGQTSRVSGRYGGVLVFGGVGAGTGTDTVRTAIKAFEIGAGFTEVYGADVGLVNAYGEGYYEALRYYRIGEVERGTSLFPVASETGPTVASSRIRVWPNPSSGPVMVSIGDPALGHRARLVVTDALGREVWTSAVAPGVAVRERVDLSGLSPGIYVVALYTEGGVASRRITVIR